MAEESKNARKYNVLIERGDGYEPVAIVEASSAEQAVRLTASEKGAGTYVAVPDRSWTKISVRVETPAPRIILDSDQPEQHSVKAKVEEAVIEPDPRAEPLDGLTAA